MALPANFRIYKFPTNRRPVELGQDEDPQSREFFCAPRICTDQFGLTGVAAQNMAEDGFTLYPYYNDMGWVAPGNNGAGQQSPTPAYIYPLYIKATRIYTRLPGDGDDDAEPTTTEMSGLTNEVATFFSSYQYERDDKDNPEAITGIWYRGTSLLSTKIRFRLCGLCAGTYRLSLRTRTEAPKGGRADEGGSEWRLESEEAHSLTFTIPNRWPNPDRPWVEASGELSFDPGEGTCYDIYSFVGWEDRDERLRETECRRRTRLVFDTPALYPTSGQLNTAPASAPISLSAPITKQAAPAADQQTTPEPLPCCGQAPAPAEPTAAELASRQALCQSCPLYELCPRLEKKVCQICDCDDQTKHTPWVAPHCPTEKW